MYGKGISKNGELIDLGAKADIIEKSGAWYAYAKKLVKEKKTLVVPEKNPNVANEIEKAIREKAGPIAKELERSIPLLKKKLAKKKISKSHLNY